MKDDEWKRRRQAGALTMLPFAMVVPLIVGLVIGKVLDRVFGTSPYLMYVFLALGFAGGVRECYRMIKRFGDL